MRLQKIKGIALAVFRDKDNGKSTSVDLSKALGFMANPPKKWFDPILERLVFRRSTIRVSCINCGRRIWFYGLSCMKPGCVRARLATRRQFKGMDEPEFDELLTFNDDEDEDLYL